MKHSVEPWQNIGIGDSGAYIRVRGTEIDKQFKVANVPFTVDKEGRFYGVKDANEIAEMIKWTPTMMRLIQAIAENWTGIDIKSESAAIWESMENFNKHNK